VSTKVGTDAENANVILDTRSSVHTSVKKEFSSISEVNIDEELTNLIRFQAGYSANAKVITTIDQMINTLLGIKQ
ncbi:MAG: flagellar basal body rod C-terminal domain-containing protein, partial [Campylobacterales bacterium]